MWMLLKLLVVHDVARHPVRTMLTTVGIALGVSIYVAMRIANIEILRSFETSTSSITGHATLQIVGGENGFDETLIVPIRNTLGVVDATPVLEIPATFGKFVDDDVIEPLLILGVDVLDQARFWEYTGDWDGSGLEDMLAVDAITVSKAFARRYDSQLWKSYHAPGRY